MNKKICGFQFLKSGLKGFHELFRQVADKATVSATISSFSWGKRMRRVVVSRVAKSLLAVSTCDCVMVFSSVDFPALV